MRLVGSAVARRHAPASAGSSTSAQHHGEVLDHQPADRDAPARRLEDVMVLQGAHQHDRAGDRERQAEDEARQMRPAQHPGEARAHQRGDGDLADRARHGDAGDRQQVLQREMQADAEHQQDDADLGQLGSKRGIGLEARRVRTHQDAGQQIADQRLHAQPVGDQPEDEKRASDPRQWWRSAVSDGQASLFLSAVRCRFIGFGVATPTLQSRVWTSGRDGA